MSLTLNIRVLANSVKQCYPVLSQIYKIHSSSSFLAWNNNREGPTRFLEHNKKIYPPQTPDEAPRPAFICHQRTNIKYSPWKMWYIACFIRGMPVDEAIKQLKFILKKGATDVREVLEEAKELSVKEHNVEFPSNMWVAESFVTKGKVIKGLRRHARARFGIVEYFHCHYFATLEEGRPPKHYYHYRAPETPQQQLEKWLKQMRNRKIHSSL